MTASTQTAQSSPATSEVLLRSPRPDEGGRLFELVGRCAPLERNTAYCYALFCTHFAKTTAVAEIDDQLVGFALGYCLPEKPHRLFVWQIGVAPDGRGRGLGKRLLKQLVVGSEHELRYLECTIEPANDASMGLFRSFAKEINSEFVDAGEFFGERHFAPENHEPETLIQIGPIQNRPSENTTNT